MNYPSATADRSLLMRRRAVEAAQGALLFLAIGCGPADGADASPMDEPVSVAQEALIGGTRAATSDLPTSGVVVIGANFSNGAQAVCTGVLLTDRWVLTAGHCMCDWQVQHPESVTVSVYGSNANSQNSQLAALYATTAASVVKHPTIDAALIKLTTTLPFLVPPNIYTGNGSDLPSQSATVWGFGAEQFVNNAPVGVYLKSGLETIVSNFLPTLAGTYSCGPNPPESLHLSMGPDALGQLESDLTVPRPQTAEGDSGGPLFLSGDASARVLVGILSGPHNPLNNGIVYDHFVGIWTIRDWIHQNAIDAPLDTNCTLSLANSAGATSPSIAEGPDGLPYVAAVRSDNTIGLWQIFLGASYLGTVPGASSNSTDPPGIGTERYAVSGKPLALGIAYRDRSTGKLKYSRWSSSGFQNSPIDSGFTAAGGPAMTKGGVIGFLDSSKSMKLTWYDPNTGTFGPALGLPAGAPLGDPTRRVSVIFEPANGIAGVGYRTTSNAWVEALGSWLCPTFFCSFEPPYANTFAGAMLAYGNGQRISLVTSLLAIPTLYVVQNRVQAYGASYPWDMNRVIYIDPQPGVAQIGNNIFTVSKYPDGTLSLARGDNCLANHW